MAVINKNQILAPFLGARLSFIPGQDPMGMLNIGEQIFSMLLPGLNNVTERIRYYSFYCWFFGWYAEEIGSEDPKEQRKYIRRAEYLLALVAAYREEGGIAGITEASKNYNAEATAFSLLEGTGELENRTENTYWKNPRGVFGQNYVSSLRQLGLIRDKAEDSGVYIRTAFEKENVVTGKDLETAFNNNLTKESKLIFLEALTTGHITQENLIKINEAFYMIKVPVNSSENTFLINMLIGPDEPTSATITNFRKHTITLYLDRLEMKKDVLSVQDFVNFAYNSQGKINNTVDETLMGWYYYQLSQYWHMVSTSSLKHVLFALQDKSDGGWYIEEQLINELTAEIATALTKTYNIATTQPFNELLVVADENSSIVKSIQTKNYVTGFCHALLLLKKLLVENKHTIKEQRHYAKTHNLNSQSDFIAVYNDLEDKTKLPLEEFIKYFLKKYIINRHQMVALNKMNTSQSTEKFLREDGYIRFVDNIDLDFSNPRIGNLVTFLKNLSIISEDGKSLTTYGKQLQNSL